jgi:hypothetical protein
VTLNPNRYNQLIAFTQSQDGLNNVFGAVKYFLKTVKSFATDEVMKPQVTFAIDAATKDIDTHTLVMKGATVKLDNLSSVFDQLIEDIQSLSNDLLMDFSYELELSKINDNFQATNTGIGLIDIPMLKSISLDFIGYIIKNQLLDLKSDDRHNEEGNVKWLNLMDKFVNKLLFAIHLCGGPPPRAPEVSSLRTTTTHEAERSTYIDHETICIVQRYQKSPFDKHKATPLSRFLPPIIDAFMTQYLILFKQIQRYVSS